MFYLLLFTLIQILLMSKMLSFKEFGCFIEKKHTSEKLSKQRNRCMMCDSSSLIVAILFTFWGLIYIYSRLSCFLVNLMQLQNYNLLSINLDIFFKRKKNSNCHTCLHNTQKNTVLKSFVTKLMLIIMLPKSCDSTAKIMCLNKLTLLVKWPNEEAAQSRVDIN
jgi:hypothetical protein